MNCFLIAFYSIFSVFKNNMNGKMPTSMAKVRCEILKWLTKTSNISFIARETGHSRSLIRKIKNQMKNDEDIFELKNKLGAPVKITNDLRNEIRNLTMANRRMSSKTISNIISENSNFPSISRSSVDSVRHSLGFSYLPPIHTFFTTEVQRENRVNFCKYHIDNQTSWNNVLFTDESIFELNSAHRWIWRRRGETSSDVYNATNKFNKKVMVFGGISYKYTTPLITIQGTIDANDYVDDCIDQSGLILGMNNAYGHMNWVLMQDGATCHTASSTIEYLTDYCKVLKNWPSNSPDINPIENLWSYLKQKVEELNPQNEKDLIDLLIDLWENLDISLIHKLIDSVPSRIQAVIDSEGFPTKY